MRRADSKKWYGALLTVSGDRLGLSASERTEIIDLRMKKGSAEELLDGVKFLPGYHMNKASWFTVILDGRVPTGELCRRLDESYELAAK